MISTQHMELNCDTPRECRVLRSENRIAILHGRAKERVMNTAIGWAWRYDYEQSGRVVLVPKCLQIAA